MRRSLVLVAVLVVLATGAAFCQYSGPVLMKSSAGVELKGTYIAAAGTFTSQWYLVKGQRYARVWISVVDTSTAGTLDSLDSWWIVQGSMGPESLAVGWTPGNVFLGDSSGVGRGDSTATEVRLGRVYNITQPEADTCRVQFPVFNVGGWTWIRVVGRIGAKQVQACKHWAWIWFQPGP